MTTVSLEELDARRERLRRWIPRDRPQPPTQGVNHLAVFAKDLEATAAFYTDVLGMPVVGVTANRDVPESTHMNVDIGNGAMLSFFEFPHVPRLRRRSPEGVGGIMHVAMPVAPERLAQAKQRLAKHRVPCQEIGGALYFKDPNGLGLELMPAR